MKFTRYLFMTLFLLPVISLSNELPIEIPDHITLSFKKDKRHYSIKANPPQGWENGSVTRAKLSSDFADDKELNIQKAFIISYGKSTQFVTFKNENTSILYLQAFVPSNEIEVGDFARGEYQVRISITKILGPGFWNCNMINKAQLNCQKRVDIGLSPSN